MTHAPVPFDLSMLTRPSGAFAMLAVDQREALRLMFAQAAGPEPDGSVNEAIRSVATDSVLTDFKVTATRELSPYASGVLVDREFGLDAVVHEEAVAPDCGLIAAADRFVPGNGEVVTDSVLDDELTPTQARELGAVAMKLLVVWRPDESPAARIELVERFVGRCSAAGLISIVEPVSRAPRSGSGWDEAAWNEGVLRAATELGDRGADVYKGEVPRHGVGSEDDIRRDCALLNERVAGPWVVLSSGVVPEAFPRAVELACAQGASGFLAGRAVWRNCVGAADPRACLRQDGVARLRELGELVDAMARKVVL